MKITDLRFFGVITGLSVGIILMVFSFVLKINVIHLNYIGQIPIYLGVVPIITILSLTIVKNNLSQRQLYWIYLGVAIFNFIYFNSMLQWRVECCPDNYESMYDWNASKGLSWVFHVPIVFINTLLQGLVFDLLIGLRIKRIEKQ